MVQNYQESDLIKEFSIADKPVVAEFFSPTCQHCRLLSGILDDLSQQFPNVLFAAIDITTEGSLAARYDIRSVPTLLFLKNGAVRDCLTGVTHSLVIQEGIRKIIE